MNNEQQQINKEKQKKIKELKELIARQQAELAVLVREKEEEEEVEDSVGIICKYTEHERKCIELLKCWVKIGSSSTFEKDWVKLQENFVDRLGLEGGRVYINKTEDMIAKYITKNHMDKISRSSNLKKDTDKI